MIAALVCWSCGERREIEVEREPRFAYEVASWANDVGWVGILDMERSRSLVFCSDACLNRQRTKDGRIRVRPLAAAARKGTP